MEDQIRLFKQGDKVEPFRTLFKSGTPTLSDEFLTVEKNLDKLILIFIELYSPRGVYSSYLPQIANVGLANELDKDIFLKNAVILNWIRLRNEYVEKNKNKPGLKEHLQYRKLEELLAFDQYLSSLTESTKDKYITTLIKEIELTLEKSKVLNDEQVAFLESKKQGYLELSFAAKIVEI